MWKLPDAHQVSFSSRKRKSKNLQTNPWKRKPDKNKIKKTTFKNKACKKISPYVSKRHKIASVWKKQSKNNFFACKLCFLKKKCTLIFFMILLQIQCTRKVLTSERKMLSKSSAHEFFLMHVSNWAKNKHTHTICTILSNLMMSWHHNIHFGGIQNYSTFLFEYGATNMFQTVSNFFVSLLIPKECHDQCRVIFTYSRMQHT